MSITIVGIIFGLVWVWLFKEIKDAPLMDDYGNIIKEDDNNKKK